MPVQTSIKKMDSRLLQFYETGQVYETKSRSEACWQSRQSLDCRRVAALPQELFKDEAVPCDVWKACGLPGGAL